MCVDSDRAAVLIVPCCCCCILFWYVLILNYYNTVDIFIHLLLFCVCLRMNKSLIFQFDSMFNPFWFRILPSMSLDR